VAIGVAVFIVKAAWNITRGALSDLLDESLPAADEARIRSVLEAHRDLYSSVRVMRTRREGGRRHVYVALEFPPSVSMSDAHTIAEDLEHQIHKLYPAATVIVEAEAPSRAADSPESIAEQIQRIARRLDMPVHHVVVYQESAGYEASLHLEVDARLSLTEAHRLATELEEELHREIPALARVDTHIEPARTQALPQQPPANDRTRIQAALDTMQEQLPQVRGIHDIDVQRNDSILTVSMHLPLAGSVPIAEAHRICGEIEAELRRELPDVQSVIIHTEPPE
jgi:divalent metal cation (Fe/Co/Zn/Cd) transporter